MTVGTTTSGGGRGITRARVIAIHYLLGFLVLGSAVSFLTGFEIWPFTPYRMYATVRTSATVENDWLYGLPRDGGAEIPLRESRYTAPTGAIISEYLDNPQDAGPALAAIFGRYEALRLAGRHDGPPLRGIRLYHVGWELQPDAGNAARPARGERGAARSARTPGRMARGGTMILATAKRRWLDYWFAPGGPETLALGRIVCYGALFLLSWSTDLAPFGDLARFWSPLPTVALLGIAPPSSGILVAAQLLWRLALLCCCIGFLTRPMAVVAFALGFYTLGMPYNFGSIKHDDAIVPLVLGTLALARAGDAYSLDRWLARRRGRAAPIAPSGEYRWPIRTIWLLTAWVLCSAGLSKLWLSGPAWVFSDNLAILLLQNQYGLTPADPLPHLGPWLAQWLWLCRLMATCTLAVEVLMPLALVSTWARRLLVPGAVLLLIGFRLALGPDFSRLIVCMAFWVPWDRALAAVQVWGGGRAKRAESPIASGSPLAEQSVS